MCWLHAIFSSFFLFLSDDSFDVQVLGVEDDGVATTLEILLLLDIHVGSFCYS